MRHELTEAECNSLFFQHIANSRFAIEELAQAFESRLESIIKNLMESSMESECKNSKKEMNRAIEGMKMQYNNTCENLKKIMEKSFEKIELIDNDES